MTLMLIEDIKEEIAKQLPIVLSDLDHEALPGDRLRTNANIRRRLYRNVILGLLPKFKHVEPLESGGEGIFIKGYVRDVWEYLETYYDVIHAMDFEPDRTGMIK